MEVLTSIPRSDWNRLVEQQGSFSLLQSWEWGAFKEELGWKTIRVAVADRGRLAAAAQMLIRSFPFGLSVAYIPRGPVGAWQDPAIGGMLFAELCRLARAHRSVFLKVEPPVGPEAGAIGWLESSGFRPSPATNQPRATIILDLSHGADAILQDMRKKTRQYVHRAEREGITVLRGSANDLPAYCELMRRTGRREHFAARGSHYYRAEWQAFAADDEALLLLAQYQGQTVAVRAIYRFGRHAAEFHAGSLDIPGLHANYLLVWEAIKWALASGCTTYDLWGIPDELAQMDRDAEIPVGKRHDGLWGVYQFKRGFSTKIVSYVGAYDYVFVPSLYRLFNLVLSWGKWWEHIAALLDTSGFGHSDEQKAEVARGDP